MTTSDRVREYVHNMPIYDKAVAALALTEAAYEARARSMAGKEVRLKELLDAIKDAEKADVDDSIIDIVREALSKYAEAIRDARLVRCKDSKYDVENFSGLREPDKTVFSRMKTALGSSASDNRLRYQSSVISNSISRLLDEKENQMAREVNRRILVFADDESPTVEKSVNTLMNVANAGLQYPNLRDEIYLQIFKLLGKNPKIMSRWRGWILLSYCVLSWPPSLHLEPYVLRFVHQSIDAPDFRCYYGKFCWEKLNDMLDVARIRDCVLPLPILQRYERLRAEPLLVDVEWPTGKLIMGRVEVSPHMKVGEYVDKFCAKLGLSEERKRVMGLFLSFAPSLSQTKVQTSPKKRREQWNRISMGDKSLQQANILEPLDMEEYLADIFLVRDESRRAKLVLSVRLFLKRDEEKWLSEDTKYEEVLYDQCYRDLMIEGSVQVDTIDAATHMARIATLIAEGPNAPTQNIKRYLPPRNKRMFADSEDVHAYFRTHGGVETIKGKNVRALRREFISTVIDLPGYDTSWFQVELQLGKGPKTGKVIGLNGTALFVYPIDTVTSPPEHVFDYKSLMITEGSTQWTTSSLSFRFYGVESVEKGVSTMTMESKWCLSIRVILEENISRASASSTAIDRCCYYEFDR